MRARSRRRLGITVLLISILGIGAYLFRGHISYLWLQNVTVPRMNSLLAAQADGVDVFEARIVQKIAHNPKYFVQGLQFDGDILWEGTGLYGESKLIKQRFNRTAGTLEPLYEKALSSDDFGEGLAVLDDMLFQLTWKAGRVYRYDLSGKEPLLVESLSNDREGWGLTTDRQHLIASDGSAFLTFRSITDFSVEQTIEVRFQGKAIDRLNELEWIDGKIWANIWMTPFIVVVDPATGDVTSVIDCRNLVEDARASSPDIDVLNGIAWDAANREFYLTGKLWPWIYKVALDKKTSP
ncbi:MAG: glutaminyl-peptide cyclotransferase [Arenicellales bacterium]